MMMGIDETGLEEYGRFFTYIGWLNCFYFILKLNFIILL